MDINVLRKNTRRSITPVSDLLEEANKKFEGLSVSGVVTFGGTNYLTDNSANFDQDLLVGKLLTVEVDGIIYRREIISCEGRSLGFNDLVAPVDASVTLGSGEGAEGQITISCKADLGGAIGNDYSIQILQGTGTSGDNLISLDEETKVLTITVDLNALGETRVIGAGDLQSLINNTNGISDKFLASDTLTAGNLPIGGDPVPFLGGDNGVYLSPGDTYIIAL
jgi:hypothetical protein